MNKKSGVFIRNPIAMLFSFLVCEVICSYLLFKDIELYMKPLVDKSVLFLVLRSALRVITVAYMLTPLFFKINRAKYCPVIITLGICEALYAMKIFFNSYGSDAEGLADLLVIMYMSIFIPALLIAFSAAFCFFVSNVDAGALVSLPLYYAFALFLDHSNCDLEFWSTELVADVSLLIFMYFSIGCIQKNKDAENSGVYFTPEQLDK